MAREDKPYRVYRGGRATGGVPTLQRSPKPERRKKAPREAPKPRRYAGPGPAKKPRRIDTYTLLGLLAWIGLVLLCLAPAARAERIKDLAQVGGVRSNPLVGMLMIAGRQRS